MLKIDALVTMLACLQTTPELELSGTNSTAQYEHLSTGTCPLYVLSALTTRIQRLTYDIEELHLQIGNVQEQIADLKRLKKGNGISASPIYLESRFGVPPNTPNVATLGRSNVAKTPTDCREQNHGIIRIQPTPNQEPFFAFCDQNTNGGGWTLVVNRFNGDENFNRNWQDYKIGFGALATEFFIGLDKLHWITSSNNYELLVILVNRKQEQRQAHYDQFGIGGELEKYPLNVLGKYTGDAADALRVHVGKKFSTFDQDNDDAGDVNCAEVQSGAWWHGDKCNLSNLFGTYQRLLQRDVDEYKGILWHGFLNGPKGSLKVARMLVRPIAN